MALKPRFFLASVAAALVTVLFPVAVGLYVSFEEASVLPDATMDDAPFKAAGILLSWTPIAFLILIAVWYVISKWLASREALSKMNIHFCTGCEQCEDDRESVQTDDMTILIDEIMQSDIILSASPSYWGDVTGQMKVFIDRSLPLCNAKTGITPVPPGKVGVSVALRAESSISENQHIIDAFEHYFGHLGIKPIARLTAENVGELPDLKKMHSKLKEAYDLGCSLINAAEFSNIPASSGPPRVETDQRFP
jgi:multimeric flavodoxin WrbA